MKEKQRKPGTGLHGNQGAKLKPGKRIPVTISFDPEDLEWLDKMGRNKTARAAVKHFRNLPE